MASWCSRPRFFKICYRICTYIARSHSLYVREKQSGDNGIKDVFTLSIHTPGFYGDAEAANWSVCVSRLRLMWEQDYQARWQWQPYAHKHTHRHTTPLGNMKGQALSALISPGLLLCSWTPNGRFSSSLCVHKPCDQKGQPGPCALLFSLTRKFKTPSFSITPYGISLIFFSEDSILMQRPRLGNC